MAHHEFVKQLDLPVSAEEAFRWHERPGALDRLLPPWERVRVIHRSGGVQDGARAELVNYLGPIPVRWVAEHCSYHFGRQFRDIQRQGPFASWDHQHLFRPDGPERCQLTDRIEYKLPGSWFGEALGRRFVRTKIARMFAFRHRQTWHDVAAHGKYKDSSMHVGITGSRGLIGSALIPFLTTGGHEVTRFVRGTPADGDRPWDPSADEVDPGLFDGIDAVVHLAGESIASRRWTKSQKQRIVDSRVNGTTLLCETLAKMASPPKVLVCASAIGFYGDRRDELLDEQSAAGDGFLPDVCQQWEAATQPARDAGIRVVNARFGVVLSPNGGALRTMLLPFRLGVGGVVGSGRQFMSWISLDDAVGAVHHALMNDSIAGPVNLVAPDPVDNRVFTKTLGRVLRRPTIIPAPGFLARLGLGEMADALLLASARVEPRSLNDTGYDFREPTLEEALRHLLGK